MAEYNIRNYKLIHFLNILKSSMFKLFEILAKHYEFYHQKLIILKK